MQEDREEIYYDNQNRRRQEMQGFKRLTTKAKNINRLIKDVTEI